MIRKTIVLSLSIFIFTSCEAILVSLAGGSASVELKNGKGYVNGVLGKKSHKEIIAFLDDHPNVNTLVLGTVPGSANDEYNVKTCLEIHKRGINTELLSNSVIESGGVDLFISGNKRTIAKGAKIGVHAWRDLRKEATDYPRDHEEHKIFLDFFEIIQMDTAFYWFTIEAAPASGMHFMTDDEIKKYGLEKL
jgi:beta-lactamase class D